MIRVGVLHILIFVFLISFGSQAQTSFSLKGTVKNSNTPVEFVNIILYSTTDSTKIINSAVSDSLGNFIIPNLIPASYILKTQAIGYLPLRMKLNIDSSSQQSDIGEINLLSDQKLLQSVDIISYKEFIKKTPSGFIINAKDNLTQAGGTATDILKNTPTIVVDPEGGITMRGKTPLILINGRNSKLANTDRIPASSIESIEIINNPTARYDADADGGIINIKLKKNAEKGTNGSVALGAGHGAAGRYIGAFNLNHSNGKWNIGLNYDARYADRTRKIKANRTDFDVPSQYYLIQNRFDTRNELTHNVKLNVDYSPNQKNSFSFEAIGNFDSQHNVETLTSMFLTQTDSFDFKNSRRSDELTLEQLAEVALNYEHKFSDSRRSLTANLSSSYDYDSEHTGIVTQALLQDSALVGYPYYQRTHFIQPSTVSNFRIDYTHPIGKTGTLETGYKGIYRTTTADFKNETLVNDEYLANLLNSNVFDFKEQIHAAYIQYKGYIGKEDSAKWRYDIGIRGEQVYNEGNGRTNNLFVSRSYFNYFPTANLIYYPKPSDYIKLSFSRRINRPGLESLNPFIDITDSLATHSGNPYLKPELINASELGYNKEWKKASFSVNLFYRYATNIIRGYITLSPNGVTNNSPINYGSATTYGAEGILSAFPLKFWSLNLSASCYQQTIDGSNVDPTISNNIFSWYGKLVNNFDLWKGAKLQLIANYNSPVGNPQGQKVAVYYVDGGLQQKLFKGRAGLGIVVTDMFNTQRGGYNARATNFYFDRQFKIDTRAVMVTFAYTFGTKFKEELIENKFTND